MSSEAIHLPQVAGGQRSSAPFWSAGSLGTRVIGATGTVASPVAFRVIATRAEFYGLEGYWNELYQLSGGTAHLFQSYGWLKTWVDCYLGPCGTLAIVTGWQNGRLVVLLPMVVEHVLGLKQVSFMGAPVSQYGDVLVDRSADTLSLVRQAWRHLIEETNPDVVRLAKVREDALVRTHLLTVGAVETSYEEAPFVDLTKYASYDAYQQRFSAKYLKNLRRLRRRLDERGPCEVKLDLNGAQAVDAAHAAVALKRAWLTSRGLFSKAYSGDVLAAFFAIAASERKRYTGVSASVLNSVGEVANAALTVSDGKRLAIHVLAYNMKFEKAGAGVLHTEALMQKAFAERIETVDFLAPRHEYKDVWTDGVVRVSDFAVPLSHVGGVYVRVYLLNAREALKRAMGRMPCFAVRVLSALRRRLG